MDQVMSVTDATLQGIPAEIRLIIYGYLLTSNNTIVIGPRPDESFNEVWTSVSRDFSRDEDVHPAIISCCTLFSCEATDVFYGNNVFEIQLSSSGVYVIPHFLSIIGQLNASKLRSFTITMKSKSETPESLLANDILEVATMVLQLIHGYHRLRVLRLHLHPAPWEPMAVYRYRDWGVLMQRQLLHGLHKIRRENAVLTGGEISLGSILPKTNHDTLELATVTWKEGQSGMPLIVQQQQGPPLHPWQPLIEHQPFFHQQQHDTNFLGPVNPPKCVTEPEWRIFWQEDQVARRGPSLSDEELVARFHIWREDNM